MALYPFYRPEPITTCEAIARLRPSALFINGGQSTVVGPAEIKRRAAVTGTGRGGSGGLQAGLVKQVTHPHRGHLIAFEDPSFCAREAAAFLKTQMAAWAAEEREYEEWTRQPLHQKTTLSRDWEPHLKIRDRPKPKM
ncbi:hypothetical protein E4U41_002311 [Claviceps citrina]|nr:hypothetical protein E4U41_002311 [Claviceps citrina]